MTVAKANNVNKKMQELTTEIHTGARHIRKTGLSSRHTLDRDTHRRPIKIGRTIGPRI